MTSDDWPEYWRRFWQLYAESFVAPLKSNSLLRKFVANRTVTGLYAEAWVRSLARNMLPQFRISTGAVIRPSDQQGDLQSVYQCDLIIWDPSELPAIFEQGDFALVPTHSVHAIVEIKRTCSDTSKLVKQLEDRKKLLRLKCRRNLLGVVLENSKALFDGVVGPQWLKDPKWRNNRALVCLLSRDLMPHTDDIMAFIYFLAQVAGRDEIVS
jgi:hypothetical protein